MMSRQQRIEYEILDLVLKADPATGYLTNTQNFTRLLRWLFPDIQSEEFIEACKRLHCESRVALRFRKAQPEGSADQRYCGANDEPVFLAGKFYLARTSGSSEYFHHLRGLVELPTFRGLDRR